MTPPPLSPRRRWLLRAAACGALALFVALFARYWHPVYGFTSLIQLDAPNDDLKITAFRDLPVYVHRDNGGYDGLYCYLHAQGAPSMFQVARGTAIGNPMDTLAKAYAYGADNVELNTDYPTYDQVALASWRDLLTQNWVGAPTRTH